MHIKSNFSGIIVTISLLSWLRASTAAQASPVNQLPLGSNRIATRPNVVFILTDDQDLHMQSLDYMPLLKKHITDRGTFYKRHFCTIAICCPSRVSLWTGKTAHNTNVTDVSPPHGGYPKFISQGLNENHLPVWLQEAGYNTYYTGKLFNSHTVDNYHSPYVKGYTGSDFLLDPFTYQYLNASFQRNQDPPISYEGQYSTDVLAEKGYGFLEDAVNAGNPFFLTLAPIGPHANVKFPEPGEAIEMTEPVSAPRHQHLFEDVKVPRTPNFNPNQPSGVNWIRYLPQQNQTNIDYNDHFYRQRLRALQAIDEIVEGVIERLESYGILDNTYVIYSTDNGYHIGQHRLQPGKECGYEEDINIPLIIRGPGVPEGEVTEIVTSHTDLAPTFLNLLGIPLRDDFDGIPIPLTKTGLEEASKQRHEHVNVEFWGIGLGEGIHGWHMYPNNTYKALRVIGKGYNLYYSVWCNNEHQLYNLDRDPYQLENLMVKVSDPSGPSPPDLLGLPLTKVIARLDSLLMVLKSCKGESCIEPWKVLHPGGDVLNLYDALSVKYDQFYVVEQPKVAFSSCETGYIPEAEGPQEPIMYRDGVHWSHWV